MTLADGVLNVKLLNLTMPGPNGGVSTVPVFLAPTARTLQPKHNAESALAVCMDGTDHGGFTARELPRAMAAAGLCVFECVAAVCYACGQWLTGFSLVIRH